MNWNIYQMSENQQMVTIIIVVIIITNTVFPAPGSEPGA